MELSTQTRALPAEIAAQIELRLARLQQNVLGINVEPLRRNWTEEALRQQELTYKHPEPQTIADQAFIVGPTKDNTLVAETSITRAPAARSNDRHDACTTSTPGRRLPSPTTSKPMTATTGCQLAHVAPNRSPEPPAAPRESISIPYVGWPNRYILCNRHVELQSAQLAFSPQKAPLLQDNRVFELIPMRDASIGELVIAGATIAEIRSLRRSDYCEDLSTLRIRRQNGERWRLDLSRKNSPLTCRYLKAAQDGAFGSLWQRSPTTAPLFPNGYGLELIDDQLPASIDRPHLSQSALVRRDEAISALLSPGCMPWEDLVRALACDLDPKAATLTVANHQPHKKVASDRLAINKSARKAIAAYLVSMRESLDPEVWPCYDGHVFLFPSARLGPLMVDPISQD